MYNAFSHFLPLTSAIGRGVSSGGGQFWSSSEYDIVHAQKLVTSGTIENRTHSSVIDKYTHKLIAEFELPPPLYQRNPIGLCTRCDALADDADARLIPVGAHPGFRVVTRMKIGYGGFNPSERQSATKSFKRSWQADKPGAHISFRFYGNTVKIAIWQRRDSMGVIHAYIDNDKSKIATASGFFKGYTW